MRAPLRTSAVAAAALLGLVPVATLAADLTSTSGARSADQAAATTTRPFDTHAPLEGTRWHLREYRAEDGGIAGAYDGGWLTLSKGTFDGSSGCNDLSGAYTLDGGALTIAGIRPTEASCLDGDVAVQEMTLLARLPKVTTFTFEGPELWLVDAIGDRHLGFVSIVGPAWTPMYGGDEPMPGGVATVRFGTNRISGQGPCNTFGGLFVQDGTSISIRPFESTLTACPDLEFEVQLLTELQLARSYAIASGDLTLIDGRGTPIRSFAAASTGG